MFRYFKYLYQKWTRGFSDKDLWNLDHTIMSHILKDCSYDMEQYIKLYRVDYTGPNYQLYNQLCNECVEAVKYEFCKYADFICPRLKRFAQYTHGHPCDLTFEQWQATILAMADDLSNKNPDLFIKFLPSLWD